MTAQNIIEAIRETSRQITDQATIDALRGIVARAQRYEAQDMKDNEAFKIGVREGWRESQEMDDRNQAFFYLMGSLKEEELSPRQLKMAAEMKKDADAKRAAGVDFPGESPSTAEKGHN